MDSTLYQLPFKAFLAGDPLSMPNTNGTPTAVTGLRGMANKIEKISEGMVNWTYEVVDAFNVVYLFESVFIVPLKVAIGWELIDFSGPKTMSQ